MFEAFEHCRGIAIKQHSLKMDYTTCMAVIILCLFVMGCLCCVWVACCGIALMETKYAQTFQNLSNHIDGRPECNINLPFKEYQSQTSPTKKFEYDRTTA